jgi:hypothetical protein
LNATRGPDAAWITAFTSASSTGVCAGSSRTPPITTTSTGRAANAARAAALAAGAPARASISSHFRDSRIAAVYLFFAKLP